MGGKNSQGGASEGGVPMYGDTRTGPAHQGGGSPLGDSGRRMQQLMQAKARYPQGVTQQERQYLSPEDQQLVGITGGIPVRSVPLAGSSEYKIHGDGRREHIRGPQQGGGQGSWWQQQGGALDRAREQQAANGTPYNPAQPQQPQGGGMFGPPRGPQFGNNMPVNFGNGQQQNFNPYNQHWPQQMPYQQQQQQPQYGNLPGHTANAQGLAGGQTGGGGMMGGNPLNGYTGADRDMLLKQQQGGF